jgi:hypothetical protein
MSYMERLLAMVVFVCLAGFGLLTQSCQADEDAVAYRTNPAHTAQNTMPDLTLPLQVKWDVNLGGDASYPLIANGEVFVLTPGTLSPGGSHYQLTALNASTGPSSGDLFSFPPLTGVPAQPLHMTMARCLSHKDKPPPKAA